MAEYVLGMFDVRGKQEFIFKSSHLQEIVGGSCIIRDCFNDYLYPQAMNMGGKGIFHENVPFNRAEFEKHIQEGYIGELVYDGGGNFLVLMKNEEIFKELTYQFTKKVYEKIGTLKVLGTCIPIEGFEHFEEDRKKLYQKHRVHENQETTISSWGTLPIVQVDTMTSLPLEAEVKVGGLIKKVSKESKAKYDAYRLEYQAEKERIGERFLDNLVEKKGEDSLLAVIYIDGNGMGAKVQESCKGKYSYEDCIAALRKLSDEINRDYVENRLADINKLLQNHPQLKNGFYKRLVLGAGDEINLICNAHVAYDVVKTYLNGLPSGASACAGISIFRSHMPYADVYALAEECCENGKKYMKKNNIENASFMDFHICQGSIGTSLDDIRKNNENEELSLPWLVNCEGNIKIEDRPNLELIEKVNEFLNTIGRSNVKGLLAAAKDSEAALEMEIHRIIAHMDESKRKSQEIKFIENMEDKCLRRKIIYDVVSVYDIWFVKKEEIK